MINQQNQQVFCNYIDKYKNNVCFIMAGTNKYKIIENIQSRVHIIGIEPPSIKNLENFMDRILFQESILLSNDAKNHILFISESSLRCVLIHLEKIKLYQMNRNDLIDVELCKSLCSSLSMNYFERYFELLKINLHDAIQILYNICDYGYSVIDILYYIFYFVEKTDILSETEKYNIIIILCEYITIFHNVHEDIVELAFFSKKVFHIIDKPK
jgi:DNA polymerase III delta prime subunit